MAWIDLTEVKRHLNKRDSSSVDNSELLGFIDSACSSIENIKGHVEPGSVTGTYHARELPSSSHHWYRRRWVVELLETPVLSVDSVSLLGAAAPTTVVEANPATGVIGWELLDTVLFVPQRGCYTVAYTVGASDADLEGNLRLAALELVAHLWRASQLNQSGGRPAQPSDQMMVMPGVASAMPFRVRELLGLYGEVVNQHVTLA